MARGGAKRKTRVTLADLEFRVEPRANVDLVSIDVECPYQPNKKIKVYGNARESGVAWLYSHRLISNAQKRAADRFRMFLEKASLSGAKAINYENPTVDGGKVSDPITDAMVRAHKEVLAIRALLGPDVYRVVELVCGHGVSITAASAHVCDNTQRAAARECSSVVRAAMKKMAVYYGYESSGVDKHR